MPRQSKHLGPAITNRTLVVDNGAHTIKAGFADAQPDPQRDCYIIPNCIGRSNEGAGRSHKIYVADQLENCKDTGEMAFRRPVEKGFIVNWDAELDIWKQAFFAKGAKVYCDPHETNLVLTEAPNCPQILQTHTDQIIFEELEFASAYRCFGASLIAYNDIASRKGDEHLPPSPSECFVLVDAGYSYSTVTPVLYGRPIQNAVKRLDVGGKTLTNLLKELASLRHWNLMDDSYLVSQIKEDTCFVSHDFNTDLERVWNLKSAKSKVASTGGSHGNQIVLDYVLPDYRTTFRGHIRTSDDKLKDGAADQTWLPLGNERFVVPEIFFNPSDIGMTQAGLPEVIIQSLGRLPPGMWPGMLANIIVTGGSSKIPGFAKRLENELRALTPTDCTVRVKLPEDPITYTWLGGARMASDHDMLESMVVTREQYEENGSAWTARQFASAPRT